MSAPTATTSSSIRCSVDAMVASRTGSAGTPSRTSMPSAPTEKSPLTGFTPECRPCTRSEEHTSELQSHLNLVCRLLLEQKKKKKKKRKKKKKKKRKKKKK